MTFTSVLFPDPLGPIRPWIRPDRTVMEIPSTARTPPKSRFRSRISRSGVPSTASGGKHEVQRHGNRKRGRRDPEQAGQEVRREPHHTLGQSHHHGEQHQGKDRLPPILRVLHQKAPTTRSPMAMVGAIA